MAGQSAREHAAVPAAGDGATTMAGFGRAGFGRDLDCRQQADAASHIAHEREVGERPHRLVQHRLEAHDPLQQALALHHVEVRDPAAQAPAWPEYV